LNFTEMFAVRTVLGSEKFDDIFSRFDTDDESNRQTDRQTDKKLPLQPNDSVWSELSSLNSE